ncbi:MAG: ABC-type transport auxiliary lipoprotein family protein, partial [Methylococcales bacterium]|nr:ABC-type transport auxiliary lipoprotein family protein [Methylococcales bacterium]
EQSANLEANWAIMDQKTHTVVSNGFSKIQAKPENATTAGTVKALNNTLATLSQELAKALSKLK